jgi:hypothetical protein
MTRDIQLTRRIKVVDETNYTITSEEDGTDLRMRCHFCNGVSTRRSNLMKRKCTKCKRFHGPGGRWRMHGRLPWERSTATQHHGKIAEIEQSVKVNARAEAEERRRNDGEAWAAVPY